MPFHGDISDSLLLFFSQLHLSLDRVLVRKGILGLLLFASLDVRAEMELVNALSLIVRVIARHVSRPSFRRCSRNARKRGRSLMLNASRVEGSGDKSQTRRLVIVTVKAVFARLFPA